jgi:hypothetical protein
MYFFGDNYEASINRPQQEVFCYGGYLIGKEDLKSLEENYYRIKEKYKIPHYLPLKWNLKDTNLSKFYEDKNSGDLLEKIINCEEGNIREDILKSLSDFKITIIFSGFRELREEIEKKDFLKWSFTNILQRISYEKKEDSYIDIVLDRDKEHCNLFCETYMFPYYFRKGLNDEHFDCKEICNNIPFISYSVTIYNPFLQIADMIIGACGTFLNFALKNKEKQKTEQYFKPIIPLIRGFDNYQSEQIFSRGLLIKPDEDKELVKEKFCQI